MRWAVRVLAPALALVVAGCATSHWLVPATIPKERVERTLELCYSNAYWNLTRAQVARALSRCVGSTLPGARLVPKELADNAGGGAWRCRHTHTLLNTTSAACE